MPSIIISINKESSPMPRKGNQSGFSALEGMLVLVIVVIVGFTGYYVWHSKQTADKTYNAAQSAQKSVAALAPENAAFVEVIQADGSIQAVAPDKIAQNSAQQGVLDAVHKTCNSKDSFVVVNYQVFAPTSQGLYVQDGGYAKIDTSCGPKAATVDQLSGSGSATYLHQQTSGSWIVDIATQMAPSCSDFDGKGYPLSIVPQCTDGDTVRAPKD
jgi:uncharacterized protein (UPF0333 family)